MAEQTISEALVEKAVYERREERMMEPDASHGEPTVADDVFIGTYQLEKAGHVVRLWSEPDGLSRATCFCPGAQTWWCALEGAETALARWRAHLAGWGSTNERNPQ